MFRTYKFRDITEVDNFLNGGLIGTNVSKGIVGLVGKTLDFTSPSIASVTFAPGTNPNDPSTLLFNDIKTQVEASVATVEVYQIGGQLALRHKASPITLPVVLAVTGTAKPLLGFDGSHACVGRIVGKIGSSTTPNLQWWNITPDGSHMISIWEE